MPTPTVTPPTHATGRDRPIRWVAPLLVFLHLALVVSVAFEVPLTADEGGYILSGRKIVADGAWETPQERLQGPLPYVASTLLSPQLGDPDTGTGPTYEDVQAARGRIRLGMLVFSLVLLLSAWRFAHDLWGEAGGLWTLGLLAASPMMIAYGALVVSDLAFVALATTVSWCLWRWLSSGRIGWLVAFGGTLGACLATKYLALILAVAVTAAVPLAVLFGGFDPFRSTDASRRPLPRRVLAAAAALLLAGVCALLTLHASYGFLAQHYAPGTHGPLVSSMFQKIEDLPLFGRFLELLPAPMVQGADYQAHVSRGFHGQFAWRNEGHWAYYLASVGTKTTLPLLVAAVAGAVAAWRARRRHFGVSVLLPAGVLLFYISVLSDLQVGIRYALFAYPVMALLAGACLRELTGPRVAGVALLGLWSLGIVATTWPHYFGYFNPLVGGSAGGSRLFHNTNLDWGQNFVVAREPLAARHPGLEFLEPTDGPRFGRLAAYTSDFARVDPDDPKRLVHWIARFDPIDHWSAAWLVYEITPESFEAAIESGDPTAARDLVLAWLHAQDLDRAEAAWARVPEALRDARVTELLANWRTARADGTADEEREAARRETVRLLQELDRADLALAWIGELDGASQFDLFFALWRAGSPREAVRWLQKRDSDGSLTAQQAWLLAAGLSEFGEFEEAADVLKRFPEPEPDDPLMPIYRTLRTNVEAKAEAMRALRDGGGPR